MLRTPALVLYVWVPQNVYFIRQILLGSRAILGSSCELSPEPVSSKRYSSPTIWVLGLILAGAGTGFAFRLMEDCSTRPPHTTAARKVARLRYRFRLASSQVLNSPLCSIALPVGRMSRSAPTMRYEEESIILFVLSHFYSRVADACDDQ